MIAPFARGAVRTLLQCALVFAFSSISSNAHAASICGVVRDAESAAPVAGAAVFLFDDAGDYTGIHAGTAADGSYCLNDVADGLYTIQVQRDDYVVAVVTGVFVESATDVDIDAVTRVLFAAPYPNPTSDQIELRFRVPEGKPVTLEVYDVAGRRVRAWSGTSDRFERRVAFDLSDHAGRPLGSGVYHARLRYEDTEVVRRFVLLR